MHDASTALVPTDRTDQHGDGSGGRDWRDRSLSALERARLLTAELTLEEKAAQLGSVWLTDSADDFAPKLEGGPDSAADPFAGGLGQLTRVFGTEPVSVPEGVRRLRELQERVVSSQRLGIPAIAHEECLTGLAAYGATAFPTPLAWAATFDEDLVGEMAEAIGSDMRALGIHQGLAPVVDVVKDYRWGRVEETLGEDPYLVSQLGAAYVAGLESTGVIATLKHFAGYAASRGARNHAPVSMGPRELADTVLPPFEAALRHGGARSVMTSYTDIDGVPSSASAHLLTTILRERWGFEGTVVADYWAVPFLQAMHHVAVDTADAGRLAIRAGVDVELPQTAAYGELPRLIREGVVDERDLDRSVERHLRHKFEAGLLDGGPLVPDGAESVDLDSARNRAISLRIAEESVVLLRDDDVRGLLGAASTIAVVGPAADRFRSLVGCYAFPNHVLSKHPGHELGIEIPTALTALRAEFGDERVRFAAGGSITSADTSSIAEAVEVAGSSDAAVVVVGDVAGLFGDGTSGEGCDAADLRLPGAQDELVQAVLATGVPTVLVVLSGRPYALGEYGAARGVVQAFFPGADGAAAVAGVLSGRVSPTGRLPVQIPRHPSASTTYLQPSLGLSNPGITALDATPLHPFGFGLTRGDIAHEALTAPAVLATDGSLDAAVTIRNSGEDTVEVVQLYAGYPTSPVVRPTVQLIGYARVPIAAGESLTVHFHVEAARLASTGVDGALSVDPGPLRLIAGPSAADAAQTADVALTGERRVLAERALRTPWSVTPAE
ncbi:glycoside hydrolase family 3 C-terminal domain-containing protein [Rathayibacter sp. VKM Ac-2856]|uniref:beta-glucosidase n=1 Tax=unclassified Rathayibacter TaxID=2609250 RepID=UPI0015648301|nr:MULTISPECIES: glycoside hydrolase family 3 N-terminal domain-containing protein [unclassified Rathayibacter]NQX05000.1 glycoside hydrolase family 3 C-terminal domain-containing protein [Rathayibacter sp. VKM Ac-2858]NQX20168.1 glycoside hydrolase family 3 C-terminal domain-containing protein [Rathayibacter sp. VKM Ac-2856]